MRKFYVSLLLCAFSAGVFLPALAQRASDPNFGHFYMARQQVTITDDGPIVNDQRTNPAAKGAGAGVGGMQGGPPPLPKAGWQPYSSEIPSVRTDLPKVANG